MPKKVTIDSCIVIGAGISGLMTARLLHEKGVDVILLDKGRGVGGRMATRRINGGVYDHGAQSFTVSHEKFGKLVEQLVILGAARIWYQGRPDEKDNEVKDSQTHYYGTNGMTHIAKSLAAGLHLLTEETVTEIGYENELWGVQTSTGGMFEAHALIMTPPVPQTRELLESSDVKIDGKTARQLKQIKYNSCLSMMLVLDRETKIPLPGGIALGGEPIRWAADSFTKGITDKVCGIVIQCGPKFSRKNWEAGDDRIATKLLKKIGVFITGEPLGYQIKRWKYAQPINSFPSRFLLLDSPGPIGFAGDGFGRASCSIESAALSGIFLAEAMIEKHL